jgi:hypothetical protein
MSSLESIGLVLGVIPLILSSLEQYKQAVSAFNTYWKVRPWIEGIERDLKFQQILLQDTLGVQLHQALLELEFRELLSDPRSPKWQSKEIELDLRKSLGDDRYMIFVKLVSRLFDAVSSLEKSFQNITDELKRNRSISQRSLRSAFFVNRQPHESLRVVRCHSETLRHFVEYTVATKKFETPQAIENINTSLEKFLEVQELAQNVENLTTGAISTAEDDDDDSRSIYSVKSKVGPNNCSSQNIH